MLIREKQSLRAGICGVLLTVNVLAASGTIKGAYAGCLTENLLDEFIGAAGKKDYRQMRALLGNGCYDIENRKFSTVDVGFLKSKIRVYAGGDSVLLYVPTEAVNEGRNR